MVPVQSPAKEAKKIRFPAATGAFLAVVGKSGSSAIG